MGAFLHIFSLRTNNIRMLIVLIKSVITFLVVFAVVRLMGKRQLGEMQPYELVVRLLLPKWRVFL